MAAKPYTFEVTSNSWLTSTVFELKFKASEPLEFLAGQFISVIIPGAGPNGRDLRRAYSIASPSESTGSKEIELCVKLVEGGPGTNYLVKLKAGDVFKGLAPYGHFVYKSQSARQVCYVSTGTGIAPFRAMIYENLSRSEQKAILLLGVRSETEILYHDEMNSLIEKGIPLEWVPMVSQPSPEYKGIKGRVTDYLRNLPAEFDWAGTHFYLCGSGAMIEEVTQILTEKGLTKEQIHKEKYF